MENKESVILKKDMMFMPMIRQSISASGEMMNLASPDLVANKDSAFSLSWAETGLHLEGTCGDNDFYDYEVNGVNPRKDLHKQGNTIALYFQPNGKTNFYRFEFSARKAQTVHYYCKVKNGKYKQKKIRLAWQANQDHIEVGDNIWSVSFDIPWETIKLSREEVNGSKFLIVRYKCKQSSPTPIVTNSVRLPANQLLTPEEWNIIVPEKPKTAPTFGITDYPTQMLNEMHNKFNAELLDRSDSQEELAKFYCELLNKIYTACNCQEFNETFRQLERFNNLPEFWDSSQKMKCLIHALWEIYETQNFGFIKVIHLVMEGAIFLANKELQEQKEKQNQREHERLEKSKPASKKKTLPFDNDLVSCFSKIWEKDAQGLRFGRKGPLLYIYKYCPRLQKMKEATLRKKYYAWCNAGRPFPVSCTSRRLCPYGKNCQNLKPEL
jgi:hypothetical protein